MCILLLCLIDGHRGHRARNVALRAASLAQYLLWRAEGAGTTDNCVVCTLVQPLTVYNTISVMKTSYKSNEITLLDFHYIRC